MQPRGLWDKDTIFVEIGVQDADLGLALRQQGFDKYLGVSTDQGRAVQLQRKHPELADQLTFSRRRRLVLHNNADVLILSGLKMFDVWKYRSVRHAQSVAWRLGWNPLWLVALVGCLFHLLNKRYSWPRLIACQTPAGKTRRLFVSQILRHKFCHRNSLHFIPHTLGLRGMFRQFEERGVKYAVLRWFEKLPEIEPSEDVDMLVDDLSLKDALTILHSAPGIQPCDIYSETGLPRSEFCGIPYYPPRVARRILDGAVRHNDLCMVPNPSDYFHSLAYHAVYHKGLPAGLPNNTGLKPKREPGHDYAGILRDMARELNLDAPITLEGLQAYLQDNDWGPTPDMLMRLASSCPRNRWLQLLAKRQEPATDDPGLAVFVLREEAVRRGFKDKMVDLIRAAGFQVLAVKVLEDDQVEFAAGRTRGGNWGNGPYAFPGGLPAVAVVAYDCDPIPPNRQQRKRFPQRTNARLFVKEQIRDLVNAGLPIEQHCNALHSSDYGAESRHLIDVFCPELVEQIERQVAELRDADEHATLPMVAPAATNPAPFEGETGRRAPLRRAA